VTATAPTSKQMAGTQIGVKGLKSASRFEKTISTPRLSCRSDRHNLIPEHFGVEKRLRLAWTPPSVADLARAASVGYCASKRSNRERDSGRIVLARSWMLSLLQAARSLGFRLGWRRSTGIQRWSPRVSKLPGATSGERAALAARFSSNPRDRAGRFAGDVRSTTRFMPLTSLTIRFEIRFQQSRQPDQIGSHAAFAGLRNAARSIGIGALSSITPNAAAQQQHGERLPDLRDINPASCTSSRTTDRVPQELSFSKALTLTEEPDRQAGPGEGMSADEISSGRPRLRRQTFRAPQFEQAPRGSTSLNCQILGQARPNVGGLDPSPPPRSPVLGSTPVPADSTITSG